MLNQIDYKRWFNSDDFKKIDELKKSGIPEDEAIKLIYQMNCPSKRYIKHWFHGIPLNKILNSYEYIIYLNSKHLQSEEGILELLNGRNLRNTYHSEELDKLPYEFKQRVYKAVYRNKDLNRDEIIKTYLDFYREHGYDFNVPYPRNLLAHLRKK